MTDHYEPSRDDLREELAADLERAQNALFDALGTVREADAQGELARAENALAAHDAETSGCQPGCRACAAKAALELPHARSGPLQRLRP